MMVVLNDIGLFLEIIGFLIFLAIPIHKAATGFLLLNAAPEPKGVTLFLNNHPRFETLLRGAGIVLIVIGLMAQFQFFNQ